MRASNSDQVQEGFGPASGSMPSGLRRIDSRQILAVVKSRRVQFFSVLGAGLAATTLALMLIVPVYTATAELMIEVRRNNVAEVNSVLSGLPTDVPSIQNQIQILTSREFARQVISRLGLQHDPEFGDGTGPESLDAAASPLRVAANGAFGVASPVSEKVVNNVLKKVGVTQSGMSTTLTIRAGSQDAVKAARIANAWLDAYVEEQLSAKYEATRSTVNWLTSRVRELAEQAQADEAAVQRYKAENGIVELGGTSGSLVDQQAATVSLQLVNAKADLAQKQALYGRVLQLRRSQGAVAASQVIDSVVLTELRNKEGELARQEALLSARYLPQHPRLIEVTSQREANRERIAAEVQREVERLGNEVAVAQANASSLGSSLQQVQSRFRNEGVASIKLKALRSIADSSRQQYEALLGKLKSVQGQEAFASPDARVVSRADVPLKASPGLALVAGLAVPASLALALFSVFVAEGLQPRLRSREQVAEVLGVPVIACTPDVAGAQRPDLAASAIAAPGTAYARSIRGALLSLGLATEEGQPRTVVITSVNQGEGKTATAVGLARIAARDGLRTLLVDANFQFPAVAHALGLDPMGGGLADVLEGKADLVEAVARDEETGAHVLACPIQNEARAGSLSGTRLKALLAEARSRYDLVIVDTAPVALSQDAFALARLSDLAVLVVQAGQTPRESAVFAAGRLGARLAGVVLTRCETASGTR